MKNESKQQMPVADVAAVLREALGLDKNVAKDTKIVRSKETKQIIVPADMKLREARDWLDKKDKEEDKVVRLYYTFDCFPLDGAVSFREALDAVYGFVANVDIPGWFGDNPPTMIGVPVGLEATKQVPWGRVQIPGVEGFLQTACENKPQPKFILVGETKQRHLPEIETLVTAIKENLKAKSIYKGKAIRLDLSWLHEGDEEDFNPTKHAPKFVIDTAKVNVSDLIFSESVQSDVSLGLFTPIEHTELVRKSGVPLKRGILLAGDPGTGKSMCASVTAKKCEENGWTFIYLTRAADIANGLRFASMYTPAVLFVEDIDRVVSGTDRTESIDEVLNAFDGVDNKSTEIITVLTTNDLEAIPPVALRNGRIDTLVKVSRPDAKAAQQLIRIYGRGLIADDADFDRMGTALANHLPAEIREAVERAKLAAIHRLASVGSLKKSQTIQGLVREQDVLAAVHAMATQHKLLEPREKDRRSIADKILDVLGSRVAESIALGVDKNAAIIAGAIQQMGMPSMDMHKAFGKQRTFDDVDLEEVEFSLPNGSDNED